MKDTLRPTTPMGIQPTDEPVALLAASFDPVTNGHLDLIERSLKLVRKLYCIVAFHPNKSYLFSPQERLELVKGAVKGYASVEVHSYEGLTANFAKQVGARFLIRGIRSEADIAHEFTMARLNKRLEKSLETIFLMASPGTIDVSSSAVKEIARYGGDISGMVPPNVVDALKYKLAQ